ncbi:MAG: HAD-IB family hydrolase [Azonexus sp.]|jgi:HAD superfamily hydrolase (TIGR01490 family)|uniref:histidinol-phosphatase n=1 Tax=Azonexus sp. TaxID=1872668 RepID=UPI00282DFAF0|nr:HAD family hydrolase [Azonexus sp.]MDR0777098.1 HAD-IB family hydrolase [Azonexus sp.]
MNLALFDLDNTLLAGDSDFEWMQFLISRGVVDRNIQEARNLEFYQHYQAGTLDIEAFLAFQLQPLARHTRQELDAWHREYMARHIRPIISDAARRLVAGHLANGDLCAVVTATNSFVTGPIVREFGIPHLIATIPAVDMASGAFTGAPTGTPAFQSGKIVRVEQWLESLGLWWGSFAESIFYSDSHNDLPLLGKVSQPVAIDPDDTLRAHAGKMCWKIITLR